MGKLYYRKSKSNWEFVNEAMIFNCLVSNKRQIKNNLYYSELSWIKRNL